MTKDKGEVARLIEQLKKNNRNLSILYGTSRIINSSLDLDEILKRIVQIVVRQLQYDEFSILFLEENKLILKKGFHHPKMKVPDYHIKLGEGITGRVAKTGKPIIVSDTRKDPRYISIRKGIRSELAVPILWQGTVIGIFNIESIKADAFGPNDLFLMSALAEQAAIAIQNAKMTQSLQSTNRRLQTINKLGKIINSSLDLDIIFKKFLEFASEEVNYHFCAVLLIEKGRLYAKAGIGFTPEEILTYSADLSEGICGKVASSGKPLMINDVTKIDFYKNQAPKTKAELAVPLKIGEEVIGVLNIESAKLNAFVEEDVVFLSALGEQAALAIRNAQNYERIKNFNAELEKKIAQATSDLQKANEELKHLNQMKSEFVSTVSHELRTPLTSIHGYVSLMKDGEVGKVNDDQKEFLGIVVQETQRLTRLINDLLDISKIEFGKMNLSLEDLDLAIFIKQYKKEAEQIAAKKNIRIETKLSKKMPIIRADIDKVKQIFHNLVTNAIKFSDKGKKVTIAIKEARDEIVVEIIDEGVGISKEDQKSIFDKFYRVDNTMTRTTGGTGLGLPIVKHLVEAHNGTISVTSELGKGSTFRFSLGKNLIKDRD